MSYRFRLDQPGIILFPAVAGGALVTGLADVDFVVTVVSPSGGPVTGPFVVHENGSKPGLYSFRVPVDTLQVKGAGTYIYTVEIGAPVSNVVVDTFEVVDEAGEVRANVSYDAAANTLRINTWLHRERGTEPLPFNGEPPTPPAPEMPTLGTFQLYSQEGVALTSSVFSTSPDNQGVFSFDVNAPAFPLGQTAAYAVVAIETPGPPDRTYRDVIGLTFSRAS